MPQSPVLSVILPAFNEESHIISVLESLEKELVILGYVEYVIIDDGSTDKTREILETSVFFKKENYIFLFHENNQGKGAAIISALKKVSGDYVIIQDADLEYNPKDIPKIYNHAILNQKAVVFGSRNLIKNKRSRNLFYLGGVLLSWLTNLLYNQKITDEATGYKMVKRTVIQSLPLNCKGFEFCPQLVALLSKEGYKIEEVPISYVPRSVENGKKIKYRDGIIAILELLKHRFIFNSKLGLFFIVVLAILSTYLFTWNGGFMGYENLTAHNVLDWLNGKLTIGKAGVGAIMMYLPFALVGKITFASSEQIMKILSLAPVIYSALTIGFLFLSALLITNNKSVSLLFSFLVGVGSLVWPYSKIGMEYQAMFLLTLIYYFLLSWKSTRSKTMFVLTCLTTGFLTLTKSYGVVFVLPVWIFFVLNNVKVTGPTTLRVKFFQFFLCKQTWYLASSVLVALLINIGLNYFVYSSFSGAYSIANEFRIWSWWEGFYGIFFAAGKSIFIYSPLLLLALISWKKFIKNYLDSSVFILISFTSLLLITAPFSYWTDETLSVRKLLPIIPLLHIPLVLFLKEIGKKYVKILSLVILVVASFYLQFINSLYPYWEQLYILRDTQNNALSLMRYSPQLSHISINNNLFLSYLGDNNYFIYKELNWMNARGKRTDFIDVSYDISSMKIPKIFLLRTVNEFNRITFFGIWASSFLAFNAIFWLNYYYYNKQKQ